MDAALRAVPATDADGPAESVAGFAEILVDLSPGTTPQAAERLSAALDAMELVPGTDFRSVIEPAERAERLALESGREDLWMRARLVRSDVLLREGNAADSGRISDEVRAWATEHDHRYLRARSHRQLSLFFRHVGDLADALAHAVQSVAHTDDDVAAPIRAGHLSNLAMVLDENDSPDEARRRFQEALDVATTADHVEMSVLVLNNMAFMAYLRGRLDEAQELVGRMRALEAGRLVTLDSGQLDTIARIEMAQGRYAEAEATLRPILDGSAEHLVTEGNGLAECLLTAAEAQRLRGDVTAAQTSLDRAARLCEERGLASRRARVREEQAQLHAAAGNYREAYEEYRRFYAETQALQSAQREARARALQAVFETEEARRESIRFREMAQRDALTGLYNRRYVDERLPVLLERHAQLSAALIDLDHFKRINDTLSHATGDAVLQQVAGLLAEAATGPAVAARLGGEEFLLILPDTDGDEAMRRCERLRHAIAGHSWQPITGGLPVTASIGVATVVDGRSSASALLADADRNLYAAKRTGRNRVVADPA